MINSSHGKPWVRIGVPVGVAYGSDVQLVTRTLLEVGAETDLDHVVFGAHVVGVSMIASQPR